jgi:putative transposase
MVFHVLNRGVGRMRLFSKQEDYFHPLVRYVERNVLRAALVERAEAWRWSSLWRRTSGTPEQRQWLSAWPVALPKNWREFVNEPQTDAEVDAIRRCAARGQPYGDEHWVGQTAQQLGLESTLRAPHRPRKATGNP